MYEYYISIHYIMLLLLYYIFISETVQDKICFATNFMCEANVQTTAMETNNIITPEHMPWFSRYVVTERVPYGFNSYDLCLELLDSI